MLDAARIWSHRPTAVDPELAEQLWPRWAAGIVETWYVTACCQRCDLPSACLEVIRSDFATLLDAQRQTGSRRTKA